jgi:Zn-dependent M28 family amino/carboxypeptidase
MTTIRLPLLLALWLGLGLCAQAPPVVETPEPPLPEGAPAAMAAIRGADLLAHAKFLASDDLGGRLTGSPGQEAAARYIADHFARLGLEPCGDEVDGERTFFQRYGIARTSIADDTELRVGELAVRTGFALVGAGASDTTVEGALRWVGRGRTRGTSAEVAADADLAGVLPVVLVRTPKGKVDRDLKVEEKFAMSFQAFSGLNRTAKALGEKGAKVVLFALLDDPLGLCDVLNYMALSPGKDSLSPRFQVEGGNQMEQMARMLGAGGGTPAMVLSPELSAQLLAQLGLDRDELLRWQTGEGEMPAAKAEPAAKLRLHVVVDTEATACNVVACKRGTDAALKDEAVVYSAHMDHVGRRMDGEVFNGADDNASGTSGLLGIATAFARAKEPVRRSVVFLAVSGEELGLWGSDFFANNPTWPGPIVANVNTDMIGRSGPESGPDEVTVTPSNGHRMFSTIVQDAARFGETLGVSFTSGDKYYERSDHFNFAKKGIPVVFFCNGEHEDYHQVSDHADKLDPRKMQTIARLAFWTGWTVANADEPPRTLGPRRDWK